MLIFIYTIRLLDAKYSSRIARGFKIVFLLFLSTYSHLFQPMYIEFIFICIFLF